MADLYIDGAVLARTRDRLRAIQDLLTRPRREMGALPSEAVAQDALRARLREFGDEWSYGIGQLGGFSAAASEALHQVEQVFRDVEDKLTSALDEAAEQARISDAPEMGRGLKRLSPGTAIPSGRGTLVQVPCGASSSIGRAADF